MILWIPTTDFFFQFDYIKGFIINKFSLNRPLMKFHLRNLLESRILVIHTCRALTLMISIDSAVVYFSPSVHTSGIKWNWVRVYRHWIITFKKLLLNKFIKTVLEKSLQCLPNLLNYLWPQNIIPLLPATSHFLKITFEFSG